MDEGDRIPSEESADEEEQKSLVPQDTPSPQEEQIPEVEIASSRPSPENANMIAVEASAFYRGPLPPPRYIREYEEVVPGSGKIIFNQFSNQGEHRRKLEEIVIEGDNRRSNHGLYIGGAIAFVVVIGAIYLIATDKQISGLATLVAALAALVGSLYVADRRRARERAEKGAEVPEPEALEKETNSRIIST